MSPLFLHGIGTRYDLPGPLTLYLLAAAFVVVVSFVLVAILAGDRFGESAVRYPRWRTPWLDWIGSRPVRWLGRGLGLAWLLAVIGTGFLGTQQAYLNPAEYLVWVYFWAGLVITSGLVGDLWSWLCPWAVIPGGRRRLPKRVGIWPAALLYFLFVCLELTSGLAARPAVVAGAVLGYTVVMAVGVVAFGRDAWLRSADPFTIFFGIIGRFAPVEDEVDPKNRRLRVYLRPWGVGLLRAQESGWDWVVFLILMLSSLAFDGLLATPAWRKVQPALYTLGVVPGRTLALIGLTLIFLAVFLVVMRFVIWLGWPDIDSLWSGWEKIPALPASTAFAFTLVPIALVYNAAHNYTYLTINAQLILPAVFPISDFQPNFALAGPATVWYAQILLIVLGHVIAVYLAHLRAAERFKRAVDVLQSQYPMLALMVLYTVTSIWILAQPVTREL